MAEQTSMANMLKRILPSAITQGELCITFSLAGEEPVLVVKKPIKKKTKKYNQVAGRFMRYFSSNKNICQNIIVGLRCLELKSDHIHLT